MTKRQAVRRCKWFWKHALKGGVDKKMILASLPELEQTEFKNYRHQCPLCAYVKERNGICGSTCPLYTQFLVDCHRLGFDSAPQEFAEQVMKIKE